MVGLARREAGGSLEMLQWTEAMHRLANHSDYVQSSATLVLGCIASLSARQWVI
jgi:hypothetical protein